VGGHFFAWKLMHGGRYPVCGFRGNFNSQMFLRRVYTVLLHHDIHISVLPLPVATGRPRPPLSKKSIDFDHEIVENEKKDWF
jgi:hypothetical protein